MGKYLLVGILLLFLCHSAQSQTDKYTPNCPIHIIIALDFSASEVDFLYKLKTALLGISNQFELHPTKLKIGIITFNRGAKIALPLTGNSSELEKAIYALNLPYMVFATDIYAALNAAFIDFNENSIKGIPKYLVLVSDGDPHAQMRGRGFQEDIIAAAKLKEGNDVLKIDPVHIMSLYSGEERESEEPFYEHYRQMSITHMKNIASDDSSYYTFEQLPKLLQYFITISSCQ